MNLNKYLSHASNVFSVNKLMIVVTGMMVVVTGMMLNAVNREIESRVTILVPLTAKSVMEVGYDSASPEYMRFMARNIVNLAFNYTSESARGQFEELLTLYAPEQRELARRYWLNIADKIEKVRRISRAFFIDTIEDNKEDKILVIRGSTVRRLGKDMEVENATINIHYRINLGRFMIVTIERADTLNGMKRKGQKLEIGDVINLDNGSESKFENVEDAIR